MRLSDRPRVLLIAELCNPRWISVPLEGWSHSRALAKVADVHLVTQIRNRENILAAGLSEDEFTALDSRPLERALEGIGKLLRGDSGVGQTTATALAALPYYHFEQLLWRRFGERIRARAFDLVHRLTPLSPTLPSPVAAACARAGVPFVLGPLNGGLPWPKGFEAARWREREWLSYVREAYKLLPGYGATRRHAAAIITGSRATRAQVAPGFQHKTVYIPENAIEPDRFNRQVSHPVSLPLKVAFVGRLVPYKGADMLLRAAAPLIRAGKVVVDIIGDGVELPSLKALARKEELERYVQFPGWVAHQHLQERLIQADVFAFPSIREFGGAVVCEAMALGLVPLVVDYGGPGEIVSPDTGFAVPLGSREQIIAAIRAVLERLVADPACLRPMGERARARILRSFTWEAKAAQVLEVYHWVLGRRDKPDFGMPLVDPEERGVSVA